MADKLPAEMVLSSQLFALKTVVTVMLSFWYSVQKSPQEAAVAFRESLLSALSSINISDVPEQYRPVFREAMQKAALSVCQSAEQSWEMEEPPNRLQ